MDSAESKSRNALAVLAAESVAKTRHEDPPVSLVVHFPAGETEATVKFHPNEDFVKVAANALGAQVDMEEGYMVLVKEDTTKTAPLLRSFRGLQELAASKSRIILRKGSELIEERLGGVRSCVAAGHAVGPRMQARLRGFLGAVSGDQWMGEEAVERQGVQILLQTVAGFAKEARVEPTAKRLLEEDSIIELCMAGLCELFKYPLPESVLEEQLDPALLQRMLRVIFPPEKQDIATFLRRERPAPRATLSVLQYVLYMYPGCIMKMHQAVVGNGTEEQAMYPRMVECMTDGSADFENTAAVLLLSIMLQSAGHLATEHPALLETIKSEVIGAAREEDIEEISNTLSEAVFVENLLQQANQNLADTRRWDTAAEPVVTRSAEDIEALEKRLRHMQDINKSLKADLRHRHEVMQKLTSFVRMDEYPEIEKALEGIVRNGWDGIHWPSDFTLLHWCAENVSDSSIVELVGMLATNVDLRDKAGMRAIDLARGSGRQDIVNTLERLRKQERDKLRQAKMQAKLDSAVAAGGNAGEHALVAQVSEASDGGRAAGGVSREELSQKLLQLKDVPAALKEPLEKVRDVGWANMEWPRGYTPLHEAAKIGHKGSVEFLLMARADPAAADEWKLRPLDYASQAEHLEVVDILQASCPTEIVEGRWQKTPVDRVAEALKNVRPERQKDLQEAIYAVLRKGFSTINWPRGFSALHLAARYGAADAVKLLLEASARPGIILKDEKGLTPLDHAKQKGHADVQAILLAAMPGASPAPAASARSAAAAGGGAFARGIIGGGGGAVDGGTGGAGGGFGAGGGGAAQGWSAGSTGPLDEEQIIKYLPVLEDEGKEAALKKLQELGLGEPGAARGLEQLEYALRICSKFRGPAATSRKQETDDKKPEKTEEAKATEAEAGADPPKGPGKGKPAPPPPPGAKKGAETPGKGKPTGPPPPGAKKGAEAPGKGKPTGPPPPGAKKGDGKAPPPPPPGGKGKGAPDPPKGGKGAPALPKGKGKGAPDPPKGKGKGNAAAGGAGGAAGNAGEGAQGQEEVWYDGKKQIFPSKKLKNFMWKPYYFEKSVKEGSIWHKVTHDIDIIRYDKIEERFAQKVVEPKKKAKESTPGKEGANEEDEEEEAKPKGPAAPKKLLVGGNNQVLLTELDAAARKLPEPSVTARAVEELDDVTINHENIDLLCTVAPTPEYLDTLSKLQQQWPNVPLGGAEMHMVVLAKIPLCKQRVDIWKYFRTYGDHKEVLRLGVDSLLAALTAVLESSTFPALMGTFLALGNFFNAGKKGKCQADGFDLFDAIDNMKGLKDAQMKGDLRSAVVDAFLNERSDEARKFFSELAPMFAFFQRTAVRIDSVTYIESKFKTSAEELSTALKEQKESMMSYNKGLTEALSKIEDPADPFRLRMPLAMTQAKTEYEEISQKLKDVSTKWEKVKVLFQLTDTVSAGDFFTLWEDLFLPTTILSAKAKNDNLKKDFIGPTFCGDGKTPNYDDLMVLWDFRPFAYPNKKSKKEGKAGKKGAGRGGRKATVSLGDAPGSGALAGAKALDRAPPASGALASVQETPSS